MQEVKQRFFKIWFLIIQKRRKVQ